MGSDWPVTTVGDVTERVTKGTTPTTLGFGFQEDGISFVKVESISEDGVILRDKLAYISENADAALARSRLQPDDVLFTIAGTIGRVALVPEALLPANTNQAVAIVRPRRDLVLPNFLRYVLCDKTFLRHAASRVVQGVQANFSLGELKAARLWLPSMPEQRGICGVLGSLDDRIDNLRQANATREAITQTLFKSWFIDFDPVRAKAEGREPEGMDAATAALFPCELEDSELGPIPKGWRVGTLEDVSDLNASKWTARKHPEIVKYIDLSGVNRNRIETFTEFEFDAAPSRARNHLREGDTIVGTVRPGNRAYAYIHAPEENLTGSTGFAVLSPKKPYLSSFVYLAATSNEAIDRLTNLADGAAYPAVRPGVVASTPCVLPSDSVLAAFAEISVPMLEGIAKNSTRAGVLAELRDTLLPRLISGKLRLPEIKVSVEDLSA